MNIYSFWRLVAAAVLMFGVVVPLVVALWMVWLGTRRARALRSGNGKADSECQQAMASSGNIVRDRL